MIAGAGTEDDALRHGPGTQALTAQCAVNNRLVSAQVKELLRYALELRRNRRAGQLNITVAFGTQNNHLAQRRRDTGGHQDFLGNIAKAQHILCRGQQGALRHINTGLFRTGDHIGGFTVTADGSQAENAVTPTVGQDPIEHRRFARVFTHTDDGHRFHLPQQPIQFSVHRLHSSQLISY